MKTPLPHATRVANFRQQMTDFARGERLRKLREDRMLSQEDAAHEIGVSVKTIGTWEKGGGIRAGNARVAAEFYGVDPESIVRHEIEADEVATPPVEAPNEMLRLLVEIRDAQEELALRVEEVRDEQVRLRRLQELSVQIEGVTGS